jgi:hypothetical protein
LNHACVGLHLAGWHRFLRGIAMRFHDWKHNNLLDTREYVWDEIDDTPMVTHETDLYGSLALLRGMAIGSGGFIGLVAGFILAGESGAVLGLVFISLLIVATAKST